MKSARLKRRWLGRAFTSRPALALLLALSFSQHGCFEEEKVEPFYGRVAVPRAQELRWSDGGLPRVFDPAVAASPPDTDAVRAIFEGLTDYDPRTLEAVPAVAVSWEPSEGGRVWKFNLRADARWTNGDPVTAQDFVRSWRRTVLLGEHSPHSRLLWIVEGARDLAPVRRPAVAAQPTPEATPTPAGTPAQSQTEPTPTPTPVPFGAEALDEHTLLVRLVRPDQNFPTLVSHPVFRPVHELGAHTDISTPPRASADAADEKPAAADEREETLISNGAFRLTRREGGGVVLERAETYWGAGEVGLDRVHFVPTADAEEALAAYRAGRVDAVTNAAFEPLALKLLAPYDDFRRETYGALTFYQFNTSRPPFSDRRVREALALALDVDRLSADVMGGSTVPARSFLPPPDASRAADSQSASGAQGRESPPALRFDPERARSLLAEVGYPGGKDFPEIRLLVNRNDQQRLLANAVAAMWRAALGLRTEVVIKPWDEFQDSLRAGDFDVARRSVVMQTLDEETNMLAMFGGGAEAESQADDPQTADTPAEQGAPAPDPSAGGMRQSAAAEPLILTEQDALRHLPAVPIYFAASFSLVKPYVLGFDTNLLDAPSLKHVRIDRTWTPPPSDEGE